MLKNEFLIVRHSYDDHSYIDGMNDTSLTSKGIEIVKKAIPNIVSKIDSDKVIIRHSSKIRAQETAEIICEYLLKHNINCTCVSDYGLTELYQGKFNFGDMPHEERVDFLQSCWDDFEYNRMQGNLFHHFGENKNRDVIVGLGENHAEWSARIAQGVLNIINDLDDSHQSINITHRGAIFEIQKIIDMVNQKISFDQVELYETIWMEYCKDYLVKIDDIESSKKLVKEYINQRSKK